MSLKGLTVVTFKVWGRRTSLRLEKSVPVDPGTGTDLGVTIVPASSSSSSYAIAVQASEGTGPKGV